MGVLLIPIGINYAYRLELLKTIGVSVSRMVIQLIFIGIYLEFLFELNSLVVNIVWLTLMLLVGSRAIVTSSTLPLKYFYWPAFTGLCIGLFPLLILLLFALLKPTPVYHAQYLIPLAGMLLGNCLTGNIVALRGMFDALQKQNQLYEGALALGATPKQATFQFMQDALKAALAPILATMATTGLVTLPGMMTGQILSGTDPMLAVKYQLVIMVAIFTMLSLSIVATLSISVRRVISPTGRLKFLP